MIGNITLPFTFKKVCVSPFNLEVPSQVSLGRSEAAGSMMVLCDINNDLSFRLNFLYFSHRLFCSPPSALSLNDR